MLDFSEPSVNIFVRRRATTRSSYQIQDSQGQETSSSKFLKRDSLKPSKFSSSSAQSVAFADIETDCGRATEPYHFPSHKSLDFEESYHSRIPVPPNTATPSSRTRSPVKKAKITVVRPGKSFSLDVHPSSSIKDVKEMIEEQEGIPIQKQWLMFGGRCIEDKRLSGAGCDFSVRHGSVIKMLEIQTPRDMTIQIFLAPTNQTFSLEVSSNDTISKLKTKIYKKEGILPTKQVLLHEGCILDNNKTLSDCHILHGNMIHVVPQSFLLRSTSSMI